MLTNASSAFDRSVTNFIKNIPSLLALLGRHQHRSVTNFIKNIPSLLALLGRHQHRSVTNFIKNIPSLLALLGRHQHRSVTNFIKNIPSLLALLGRHQHLGLDHSLSHGYKYSTQTLKGVRNMLKYLLPFRANRNEHGTFDPSVFTLFMATSKKTKYVKQTHETTYNGTKPILVVCTDLSDMEMANKKVFSTGNHPVEMFGPMLHLQGSPLILPRRRAAP